MGSGVCTSASGPFWSSRRIQVATVAGARKNLRTGGHAHGGARNSGGGAEGGGGRAGRGTGGDTGRGKGGRAPAGKGPEGDGSQGPAPETRHNKPATDTTANKDRAQALTGTTK